MAKGVVTLKLKVYICGPFSYKAKFKMLAAKIKKRSTSYSIVSSWIYRQPWMFRENYNGQDALLQQKLAMKDMGDIKLCDVFFMPCCSLDEMDALCMIELGQAAAMGKPLVGIGERFCQYLFLPNCRVYESKDECLDVEFPFAVPEDPREKELKQLIRRTNRYLVKSPNDKQALRALKRLKREFEKYE